MKSFKQHDSTDCGPACLGWIADHYQLQLSMTQIRLTAGTDQTGTSALGLVDASRKLGFLAKGVKGTFASLFKIPLPAIAHVELSRGYLHYIVVRGITKKYVMTMDPVDGTNGKLTHDEFKRIWTEVLVLLVPGESFSQRRSGKGPAARFWALMKPHRWTLFQSAVGAIVMTLLGLASSLYIGKVLDVVIVDSNRPLLNMLCIVMLSLVLVRTVLGTVQSLLLMRTAQQMDCRLMMGYFEHVMHLPQRFMDTMRVGEVTSRFSSAAQVRSFINTGLVNLILSVLTLIVAFCAMFFYSWEMAFITCLLLAVYSLIFVINNYINRTYQRRLMETSADLGGEIVESLGSASTIKRFGIEWLATLKTENKFIGLMRMSWTTAMATLTTGTAGGFVIQAYSVVILWFGATLVIDARLTPGQLMTCTSLAGYLTGPITALLGLNQTIQSALIAADRLFEILDVEREDARGGGELKESMLGDIVVEDLTFNHPGRTDVLVGVNIRFEKGKITALTGESGCGKSTLLALLQRLYPQEKGRILIGDTDIRTVSVESLRRVIGVIPQQVDLLSGSITENVAIGDFPPDLGRIERVCQMASFSEFVKSLPSGYDTILSEDGKNLSGGQRQRLALARVFYRDSHILLLDEPSSALDAASEQVLLRTLKLLKAEGKTIIIVAHKRRLVSLADKVFRIEKGKAVPIPPVNGKIHDGELDVDQPITIACDGTLDERKASVAVSINE